MKVHSGNLAETAFDKVSKITHPVLYAFSRSDMTIELATIPDEREQSDCDVEKGLIHVFKTRMIFFDLMSTSSWSIALARGHLCLSLLTFT